ncbi:hypothetical protein CY35_08G041300 [Sphagnum magellanicum]|nr:hypothetical protein CY35_08G041300 [Sphagnum magellanicum]
MGETLKGFEPIYGTIQGQIEEATFQEQYPFLFCLRAKDDTHLQFFTTDFHSNTWLVEKSIGELEELRDDVGVGESWEDFIGYMRDAFASGNVKMVLGGPMGSRGHASAKVRAQKVKGTPRIDLKLSKLEGNAAHDIMGAIVNSLFKRMRMLPTYLQPWQMKRHGQTGCNSKLTLQIFQEEGSTVQLSLCQTSLPLEHFLERNCL